MIAKKNMKILVIISFVIIGLSTCDAAFSESIKSNNKNHIPKPHNVSENKLNLLNKHSEIKKNISQRYIHDLNIINDAAVLFHENFETGWGRWDAPSKDTQYLHMENNSSIAHSGTGFLRSTVTKSHLESEPFISSSTTKTLDTPVDRIYWRFYARMKGIAPNPHHWVRMSAGDDSYYSSGLANTVPSGDKGFWFDFDITNNDIFNFYNYWYKMRSGRCNDGTAIPGCEGDQGVTYFYGNSFIPPNQTSYKHDEWICIEIMGKTNDLNTYNGELAFWINGKLIENYRTGNPIGTWLRATFHTNGCKYFACTEPMPFEGFDFRSNENVKFKRFFLDAYYQLDTFLAKKSALENKGLVVSNEQTIYYDDVVVATERIGCMVL